MPSSSSRRNVCNDNVGVALVLAVTTSISYLLYLRNKSLSSQLNKKRKKDKKNKSHHDAQNNPSQDNVHDNKRGQKGHADDDTFQMRPIGTILSPFPLRAGTPRQGLLAKHARSILVLADDIPMEMVEDLEQYSHVWILFQFHLNPVGKGRQGQTSTSNTKKKKNQNNNHYNKITSGRTFAASKIKPPRANGQKVGVLATRSPHRPNPIGLSLAMVECVTTTTNKSITSTNNSGIKQGHRPKKSTVVHLLGLDLVDGTPVYDIKPYLPFDGVVGVDEKANNENKEVQLRTPSWVVEDGELSSVQWTDGARESLRQYRADGLLEPFYPPIARANTMQNGDNNDEAMQAISEVIGQDPRACHEGRGCVTLANSTYEISFCNLRVFFTVGMAISCKSSSDSSLSKDDNDEDNLPSNNYATITQVIQDKGDEEARHGSYQHNLAMRRRAESISALSSRKILKWMYPVREGSGDELYMLRDGSTWSFDDKI